MRSAGSIFFDMRALHGSVDLLTSLRDPVLAQAPQQRAFLAHLAKHAVAKQPPLGFFRGFVLEGAGDHVDTLDLKRKGIGPIVDLAPRARPATGTHQVSTRARLRAVASAGRLGSESAADLAGALEFIGRAVLRHQGLRVRAGLAPDNYVRPDDSARSRNATCGTRSVSSSTHRGCSPELLRCTTCHDPAPRARPAAGPPLAAAREGPCATTWPSPSRRPRWSTPVCGCSPSTSRRPASTRSATRSSASGWCPWTASASCCPAPGTCVRGARSVGQSAVVHG